MEFHDEMDEMTLNAYVDGQLDAETERSVLRAMEVDPQVREQVHRLRRARDWMRSAFADAEPPSRPLPRQRRERKHWHAAAVAVFAVVAVGLVGSLVGYRLAETGALQVAVQADPSRVVLHIDESRPEKFGAVLDYAQHLLEDRRADGIQVEVIANAGGVDLMRAGVSPYEERVRQLSERYHNLQFIACANALRNLRKQGVEPVLIDDVRSGTTAIDQIVRRIRDGWTYKKVNELPGI